VFAGVLDDLSSFDGEVENEFVAYLAAVVRNRIIDSVRFHEAVRRDRRRHRGSVSGICAAGLVDVESLAVRDEELRRFTEIFEKLPRRARLVLDERVSCRRSFHEIARRMGFPTAEAARKAFHRTKARVLVLLRAHGLEPGG
jgi:RNA polymerase sigma factor (sigma-70 family)